MKRKAELNEIEANLIDRWRKLDEKEKENFLKVMDIAKHSELTDALTGILKGDHGLRSEKLEAFLAIAHLLSGKDIITMTVKEFVESNRNIGNARKPYTAFIFTDTTGQIIGELDHEDSWTGQDRDLVMQQDITEWHIDFDQQDQQDIDAIVFRVKVDVTFDERGYMCLDVTKFKLKDKPLSTAEALKDVEPFDWCDEVDIPKEEYKDEYK